jgi:hypothetical protein
MWILADFEPVAAFGLRPSNTTSSGGKSLVCPTPYAIKMALLDRMIRHGGLAYGIERFPLVRDLAVRVQVPEMVVVNRTFQKVLRPEGKLWNQTIAQREYCFHTGTMKLALGCEDENFAGELPLILSSLNYFGRKGSFMQYLGHRTSTADPASADGFVDLCREPDQNDLGFGFLQRMDNMRSDATFEEVSVLSRPSSDGGRITYNVILPYRLKHHGFNHTVYERVIS